MNKTLISVLLLTTLITAETLFEVKDASNNKVLDVSTDGLRVLNGTDTLMVISTDGIRAYIQKDTAKGLSRSFSVTTASSKDGDSKSQNKVFEVAKDAGSTFYNPNNSSDKIFSISKGSIIANVNPGLNRDFVVNDQANKSGGNLMKISNKEVFETVNDSTMLWYKDKNAFRIGYVLINSDADVGRGSFASGYQSRASGNFSTAMGTESVSSGSNSCAIGYKSEATGGSSFALGYAAQATAPSSFSFGMGCKASGQNSLAMGFLLTEASAQSSTAIGFGSKATAQFSTSIGTVVTATGDNSTAMGFGTTSQSYNSFVVGRHNTLAGNLTTWVDTDPLFVVGNGSSESNRSNAFTVFKNGNSTLTGGLSVNGYTTSGGLLSTLNNFRITTNPGTGTTPTNYVYQGNTNSTAKEYAFTVNDALWVTNNTFIDGNILVAENAAVPIAFFRNTVATNDAYFALQSGDSLNVNRWDFVAGTDGSFKLYDKNANSLRLRIYPNGSVYFPTMYSTSGTGGRQVLVDASGKLYASGAKVNDAPGREEYESLKYENKELRSQLEGIKRELDEIKKIVNR